MDTGSFDEDREEAKDEWIIDSIKRYRMVNMFDVLEPIVSMDWVRERDSETGKTRVQDAVFISDKGSLGSDILRMTMPDCLVNSEDTAHLQNDSESSYELRTRTSLDEVYESLLVEMATAECGSEVMKMRETFARGSKQELLEAARASLEAVEPDNKPSSAYLKNVLYGSLCLLKAGVLAPVYDHVSLKDSLDVYTNLWTLTMTLRKDECGGDGSEACENILKPVREILQRQITIFKRRLKNLLAIQHHEKKTTVVAARNCAIVWGEVVKQKVHRVNVIKNGENDELTLTTSYHHGNHVEVWREYEDENKPMGARMVLSYRPALEQNHTEEPLSTIEYSEQRELVCRASVNSLFFYDLESRKELGMTVEFPASDVIAAVRYVARHDVVVVTSSGALYLVNTDLAILCSYTSGRPPSSMLQPLTTGVKLVCAVTPYPVGEERNVDRLFLLFDDHTLQKIRIENRETEVSAWRLAVVQLFDHQMALLDSAAMAVDPYDDDRISVAGSDGKIYIYDTTFWTGDMTSFPVPLFVHDGHVICADQSETPRVSAHAWYPSRPDTLLSCALDGSLHVWEPCLTLDVEMEYSKRDNFPKALRDEGASDLRTHHERLVRNVSTRVSTRLNQLSTTSPYYNKS